MDASDSPALGVGFAIDPTGSFDALAQIQRAMNTTEARVVADAAKIEKATAGMVNVGGATVAISAYGNALTGAGRDAARAEKAAESMIRQIERQVEVFGKSSSEIRQMRAELRATEADSRGLTEVAARLRAVSAQMNTLEAASGKAAVAGNKNAYAMRMTAMQIPDIVQGLLTGQRPFTVFIQQGGQIAQIAQMAEGGIKGFASQLGALALRFSPFILTAGAAVGAFALFDRAVSKGVDTKKMIDGLGLTHAQIKRLENTSVTSGDVIKATFQVMAERVGLSLGGMSKWFSDTMDLMTTVGRQAMAGLYAAVVGTFSAMAKIQQGLATGKSIGDVLADIGSGYKKAFDQADGALKRFGADVAKQTASNKLADFRKQAADMKADEKPKTDKHAEALAREAAAIEAQIKNLYKLAGAYGVSGAAALIAEAREKAESQAIKQRADIEAAVDRQVRLSIAQRVADAAKGNAALRDQAAVQEKVNAMVAAGIVPAERAAELVRNQIADLPLLDAIGAAQQRNLATEAERATKELEAQRAARARLTAAENDARLNASISTGNDKLAELREELRLVGATEEARSRALATLRAQQEVAKMGDGIDPAKAAAYVANRVKIAGLEVQARLEADAYNNSLRYRADLFDILADKVQQAGRGMAEAFGDAGRALGDMATAFAGYAADQERARVARAEELKVAGQIANEQKRKAEIDRINSLYAARDAHSQIGLFGDMTAAAKGFFDEKSKGYKALATAEKVFRAIEFALSVKAMVQHAAETASAVANSAIRAAKYAVEAVAKAISSMPFPLNLVAGAATAAALAAIGISIGGAFGGSSNNLPKANDGTGTVLGDTTAKSDSIKRSIDALKEVDTTMLTFSRQMAASLKSIDSQIGGFATVLVRNSGNINASAGVTEGFKANAIGSVLGAIPLVGGILKGLFGTTTTVLGNGLYGGAQSLGGILSGGFNAQYYSDIEKKSKFLGIVTSKKYSTQYSAADPTLTNQFTLILRQFNDAIAAAAGPLGQSTDAIQQRLNGFVVNIGKIDLRNLTGEQIQEKLSAIFGQVADNMATAAFPGISKFQKVGEGAFETLVRVASTLETVNAALAQLGNGAVNLSMDAKLALADQFDSVSAFSDAVGSYFTTFYSKEEQAAARTAQFADVFASLGITMPSSIAAFRALVESQDLTTAAGQATYATLLKLAPAFADLQTSLLGAKSAADIMAEREDLERQLLEAQGNKAAIRALDLAKLDASNRALQEQIWAVQDAQDAAKAAQALADAWTSVGDSIMDEVKRIRGLTGASDANFATLLGQFNAANAAARAGDQDAAKSLPGLSQSLLKAAQDQATSRQELDRVQAQTAAQLEATYKAITVLAANAAASPSASDAAILSAVATNAQASQPAQAANDDLLTEVKALRSAVDQLRSENNKGHAATAGNTGRIARTMDNVTQQSGGDAISTVAAA